MAVISLGASPLLEYSCLQQMSHNPRKSHEYCEQLITLIRLKFGDEPQRVKFVIDTLATGYSYYVVECYFDSEDFRAVEYVLRVSLHFPTTWDDILPSFVSLN
jgi:hypothetical protein